MIILDLGSWETSCLHQHTTFSLFGCHSYAPFPWATSSQALLLFPFLTVGKQAVIISSFLRPQRHQNAFLVSLLPTSSQNLFPKLINTSALPTILAKTLLPFTIKTKKGRNSREMCSRDHHLTTGVCLHTWLRSHYSFIPSSPGFRKRKRTIGEIRVNWKCLCLSK